MGNKISGIPLIFNFRVDEIRSVETPGEILDFETLMKKSAVVSDFDFSPENIRAVGTHSCCGGRYDDCDQILQ